MQFHDVNREFIKKYCYWMGKVAVVSIAYLVWIGHVKKEQPGKSVEEAIKTTLRNHHKHPFCAL